MEATLYNQKSSGVKRLMREAMELKEPTEMYSAQPCNENLFEWHFTIRGPADTDFDGGIYHGRIIFPSDYPMKPPNFMLLTPNGRFELNKKICLSISNYHPETWLASWSVRTALLALIGFMPSEPGGAIGSLSYPPEERKKLAKLSRNWSCKECGLCMKGALKSTDDPASGDKESSSTFVPEAASAALAIPVPAPEPISSSVPRQTHAPVQSNGVSIFAMSAMAAVLISIFVLLVIRRVVS